MKTQHNNNGKIYTDSKTSSNNIRQNAGQETEIIHHCDLNKKTNAQKSNVPELLPDLVNTKNYNTYKYSEAKFPKINVSSTDMLHFKRPVTKSKYHDTPEQSKQPKDMPSVFQKEFLGCKLHINKAEKYCDNMKSSLQINHKESKSNNLNPNSSDLDAPSDA